MLSDNEIIDEIKKRFDEAQGLRELLNKQDQELKIVNEKLSESEDLKSHFISNVTNEIVNPFASVLGLSKSILASKSEDLEKIKNMARLIHSEAFDLDFQLRNIFTAAKVEAGEAAPEFVKTDINMLISSIVDSYKYKAENKQLQIKLTFDSIVNSDAEPFFLTDPEKLKLIISNLLSNGIKYSNAANKIEVKSWMEEDYLKISVKDYGIGINEKDLNIIFDRFKRVDTTINSVTPGHGLGLSVSKALLDLIDGEIEIASKRNLGSIFTVKIPKVIGHNTDDIAMDGNEFIFGDGDDEIF